MDALDRETVQQLLDMADGDESFVRDVLATYVEQSRDQMRTLRAAFAARNHHSATRAAHSLAGASLNVGAIAVATLCRRIEASAATDTRDVAAVEAELERVCDEALMRG